MTVDEIKTITDLLQATSVPTVAEVDPETGARKRWPDALMKQVMLHLRPLPYPFALKHARNWATTPNLDERGHEHPKYLSTLTDVLKAVGVPIGARHDLARAAITAGAEMMVDLRSVNELTYVGPDDPIPQGCYEYLKLNKLPVPARAVSPAALSAPAAPNEALVEAGGPSGGIRAPVDLSKLRAMRRAQETAVVGTRTRHLKDVTRDLLEVLRLHAVPEGIVEAIVRLAQRYDAQIGALESQRLAYEEMWEETLQGMTEERPGLEGLLSAFDRLAARVAVTDPGALPIVLERVARAVNPRLADVRVTHAKADPLVADSPVSRVVVDCRVPLERPPRTPRVVPTAPQASAPRSISSVLTT